MSLIEDIKRDREAGTPGPWMRPEGTQNKVTLTGGTVFKIRHQEGDSTPIVFVPGLDDDGIQEGASNADRISRVPDMEAALLAADAMDEALTNCIGAGLPEDVHASARLALTAFRKACK